MLLKWTAASECYLFSCVCITVLYPEHGPVRVEEPTRQLTRTDIQNFSLVVADPEPVNNLILTREPIDILHNIQTHSCNHCCSRKSKCITPPISAYMAFVIQHAVCICRVACLTHFGTLSHKLRNFRGGGGEVTEYKMCVSVLSTTFVKNIPHSKKKWVRYDQKCILVFRFHEEKYAYNIPFILVWF
jgi:hypothetical protein